MTTIQTGLFGDTPMVSEPGKIAAELETGSEQIQMSLSDSRVRDQLALGVEEEQDV